MKKVFTLMFLMIGSSIGFNSEVMAQVENSTGLNFEVEKVFPSISISKSDLMEAKNLLDINPRFEVSWIREYISVDILTFQDGVQKKASGINGELTATQKTLLSLADVDREISVQVKYIPENDLVNNGMKENNFSFTLDPENDAEFLAGKDAMLQLIKEQAIDKIPESTFGEYQLAAIKFTVDKDGEVVNPHILWSSNDEKVDAYLMSAICNMPRWKPAEYANGIKVAQEFALSVGDSRSCASNLINFKKQ